MIAGRLRAAGKMWTRAAGKVWTSGRQSGKMGLVPESGRQKIFEKVPFGVDKSGRQGYDGTISQSGRDQEMNATAAPQNTKCNPAGHACATGKDAVHMVDGRPLCAFHSPYDVVEANGKTSMENYLAGFDKRQQEATEAAEQETTEIDSDSSTWSEARKEAYRQETARMMVRIGQAMDESNARVAGPEDTRKYAKEYSQYISDGIGDTDGWFSPLSYEAWVHFFAPQD